MKLSKRNEIIKTKDSHHFIKQKGRENVTVVDLGFNEGKFEKSIAKVFDNFTAYCVEANPKFLNTDDNIHLDNFLLSNKSSEKEKFYLDSNNDGASSKYFISDEKNYLLIETITLKDYYNYRKINKADILKINIEGAEFDILDNETINFLSKNTEQIWVSFHNFLVSDNRYELRLKEIYNAFKLNKFYKIKFSLNDDAVLFINKNFIDLSMKEKINLNLFKYLDGFKRRFKIKQF